MFTSKEVLEFIEEFSKTQEGHDEIKKHAKGKRDFVAKWYDKKKVFSTIKQIKRAAIEMQEILYKHIVLDTVSTGTAADGTTYQRVGLSRFGRDNIIALPPASAGNGEYLVNLTFKKEALRRDSLVPTSDGIDDIVSLFVHGYKNAKNSVHGVWHGVEIHTKRNRPANKAFLTNAIQEINNDPRFKGRVTAFLYDEYK